MKPCIYLTLLLSWSVFSGCSPDSQSSEPQTSSKSYRSTEYTPAKTENQSAEDNCGSLKPLLKLLPKATEMVGLPETFRGCENSSEQSVSVIYSNEDEEYTEYKFTIHVLDAESIYAKANMLIKGANPEQQAFINNTFKLTGDMRKAQLEICRQYDQNPAIPDGRNPLITRTQNLDTCVMDNLDANKQVWNIFAFKRDLEFRLVFEGFNAGKILTTEDARNHLAPLFDQFALGEIF